MNIYEYTCTLFMNKLDIKQRKEDLKKITKTVFFILMQHYAQIFWKVKRKKNRRKTLFITLGGWIINRLLIRSTLQFQTGFFRHRLLKKNPNILINIEF